MAFSSFLNVSTRTKILSWPRSLKQPIGHKPHSCIHASAPSSIICRVHGSQWKRKILSSENIAKMKLKGPRIQSVAATAACRKSRVELAWNFLLQQVLPLHISIPHTLLCLYLSEQKMVGGRAHLSEGEKMYPYVRILISLSQCLRNLYFCCRLLSPVEFIPTWVVPNSVLS